MYSNEISECSYAHYKIDLNRASHVFVRLFAGCTFTYINRVKWAYYLSTP